MAERGGWSRSGRLRIGGRARAMFGRARRIVAALALGAAAASRPAGAQTTVVEDGVVTRLEAPPRRLSGIDVEEHLDRPLPLGLEFQDTAGTPVTLSRYVRGERPVIFTLNYSDCPMLCSLQLSGLSSALGKLDRRLGQDFDVVTVSLDPKETSQRARETEARYRSEVAAARGATDPAAPGWFFLTGSETNIDALAQALGVSYGYNEARKEYVHPAVLVLVTPEGRISRYLYGIEYQQKTLSLSLVEAAEGKIGTSMDQLLLYCFHYDEAEGRYAPVAMNIMRVGGSLTALGLGGYLGAYWWRHARRRRRSKSSASAPSDPAAPRDVSVPRTGDVGS